MESEGRRNPAFDFKDRDRIEISQDGDLNIEIETEDFELEDSTV